MNFKRSIRKILLLSLCAAAAIATARFCHHATHGFRLSKVRLNLLSGENVVAVSDADKAFLSALFQQKFHYLNRGLQSFAFESEDGNYVLKLFNNRYIKNIQFFSLLSRLPIFERFAMRRADYFQSKLTNTIQSYEIAFAEMQEQTGLLYIHLQPTMELPSTLTIVDPLNISHKIDPNHTGFLIQKKATLVYPALQGYVERSDMEGAKRALSSLVDLFFWKWRKGIADNDPLIRTNYGFIGDKAVQIDVGPLSKPAVCVEKEEKQLQIDKITSSLKFWLNENAPELTPFLEQELREHLSSVE